MRGDVRGVVLPACRAVGRPIFFSVVIMLLSFLPVFALGGMEGKMFRPLAFTKCFALVAVAVLAITLVPALCTIFIKGRLYRETDSWLVRTVVLAYRPVLSYLLDRPAPLLWLMGVTLLLGLAPLGIWWLFLLIALAALIGVALACRTWPGRFLAVVTLAAVARNVSRRSSLVTSLVAARMSARSTPSRLFRIGRPATAAGLGLPPATAAAAPVTRICALISA